MINDSEDYTEPPDQRSEEMEISMLARKSRNLGRLQEPLSNSILKYNLDLPIPNASAAGNASVTPSLHDIERHIYTDVLGRVANRDLSGRLQQQQSFDRHPTSSGGPDDDSGFLSHLQPGTAMPHLTSLSSERGDNTQSPYGDDPSPEDGSVNMLDALPYFIQSNDYDGWQVGLDSLADTMLSHEELFF